MQTQGLGLPAPPRYLSKPPKKAPPQVPQWSPCIDKGAPSPEPSLPVSQSPQKRTRPPGSPHTAPT
jgi:hypothetical protein